MSIKEWPEGAQFYANGRYRKHEGVRAYSLVLNTWMTTRFCTRDEYRKYPDFEINPDWVPPAAVPTSALDSQEGGDHYKKLGAYQPWEVLHKWLTPEELKGFMKGTVIAYLAREEDKGGRLDIEKARHTMEIYLELTGSNQGANDH